MTFITSCGKPATSNGPDFAAQSVAATSESTICIGPKSATRYLIYLHGMDTPIPSQQEVTNRILLSNLATMLGVRIALPRATTPCPTQPNLRCWGWSFNAIEIENTAPVVDAAAKICFPPQARYGFLGFSNGGYFLLGAYRLCLIPKLFESANWAVLVGAARAPLNIHNEPKTLATCGEIGLMSGEADTYNSDLNQQMLQHLLNKNANAWEITYPGAHELPAESLKSVFGKSILLSSLTCE